MSYRLARTPWALAARGVAAAAFGVLTLAWPTMTVATFLRLFAGYAVLDGVLTLVAALRSRGRGHDPRGPRDPLFVLGAVGVLGGVVTALWTDATMQAILGLVAVWAAATGGLELYLAVRGRPRLPARWLLAGAGAAGVALAVLLLVFLAAGEVRVGWEVAAYGLAAGGLRLALARRLAVHRRGAGAPGAAATPAGAAAP